MRHIIVETCSETCICFMQFIARVLPVIASEVKLLLKEEKILINLKQFFKTHKWNILAFQQLTQKLSKPSFIEIKVQQMNDKM